MSCFEIIDPRFKALIDPVAFLETIHIGNRWAEGPVWFGDLRCLVWSDIPNSRMLRWDEESGHVSLFRKPTPNANGNTRDREGHLITCEQGGRQVVRTEWDGSITVLAAAYKGRQLNSPNDVVVRSDGSVWFTDPNYGIISDYVGEKRPQDLDGCNVFRIDPVDGRSQSSLTISRCRTVSPSRRMRPCCMWPTPVFLPTTSLLEEQRRRPDKSLK